MCQDQTCPATNYVSKASKNGTAYQLQSSIYGLKVAIHDDVNTEWLGYILVGNKNNVKK